MQDKSFDKQVRKSLSKSGWSLVDTTVANFIIRRDIFVIHVLLGNELFDPRFPPVDTIFSKKLAQIRSWQGDSILVVIRDRETLRFYPAVAGLAVLHLDELDRLNNLDAEAMNNANDDAGAIWAADFIKPSARTCMALSAQAAGASLLPRALFWAESAVAADAKDPKIRYQLAIRRLALNDPQGAADAIAAAIEMSPPSATFLYQASVIEASRGEIDAALGFAEAAVAAVDRRAVDYHQLALMYLRKSNLELSEKASKTAVTLAPENPHFLKTLQMIQSRREASRPSA